MKTITLSGLLIGTLLLALIITAPMETSYGAKPGPPPLPPIRFRIQYWQAPDGGGSSQINGMNNLGQVVGWYEDAAGEQRAYLYDPAVDPALAIDLSAAIGGAGVPEDWKIASAVGINDHGVVVGYLAPVGSPPLPANRQGYVLDTNAAAPQVVPLPNWGGWEYTYAKEINENGDILGLFRDADGSTGNYFFNPAVHDAPFYLPTVAASQSSLNNPVGDRPAQVAAHLSGVVYRWTPDLDNLVETITGLNNPSVVDINDAGTMCGGIDVTTTVGKGKNATTSTKQFPMRFSGSTPNILSGAPDGSLARAINSTADVLIDNANGGAAILYRDDWAAYGSYINVNNLVTGPSAELAIWNAVGVQKWWSGMNERGLTADTGQVVGSLFLDIDDPGRNFLLIPVSAQ